MLTGLTSLVDIALTIYLFGYYGCFDSGGVPDEDPETLCSLDKSFVAMAVCFNAWYGQAIILIKLHA